VLALVLTALWFRFVHAPSPEVVCDHLVELTRADAGAHTAAGDAAVARIRETCVESKLRYIRLRNRINYATHAKCIVAARSLDEVERC
jgi:hypothetical protein